MESRWASALHAACAVIPAGLFALWVFWTAIGAY